MKLPQAGKNIILIIILIIGVMFCIHNLWLAYSANSGFGFPLDDSWIHLQFARNLHDYGAFSYYKNEMTTAGSTSPLYTILLAIGFFFTSNEFLLSYTFGIVSLVIAAYVFYKLVLLLYENNYFLAVGAVLLLILEPRLQWIAISGMETTLFIALLLAVLYFYYSKKTIAFGIASGLLLWARPEAVILFAVIAFDIFYNVIIVKHESSKKRTDLSVWHDFLWLKKSAIYAAVLVVAYVLLNLYLSGSIFPNTYAAKLKYYSGSNPNYLKAVFHFLTDGHFFLPSIFFVVSFSTILWKLWNRQKILLLVPFLWSLMFFIAYWKNLPMLFQNGRYIIPLLPYFLLISIGGLIIALDLAKHKIQFLAKKKFYETFIVLLSLIVILQFVNKTLQVENSHAKFCRYINDRHVKTAMWLRDNLTKDAIVATHDIGAIAFYSGKRVVDMVGLVSPEMIKNLMNADSLLAFMKKNKVTHVATLQTWFPIVNNNPIFQTDPEYPEVMEVYKFIPEQFHISSHRAIRLNKIARYYLEMGNANYALEVLQQSLLLDPLSAPTNFLLGKTARMLGNIKMAEERFQIVGQLQPDYPDLMEQLNEIKKSNVSNNKKEK